MPRRDEITPDLLLDAYRIGVFPMSDGADDPDLFWVEPRRRGILPLDAFHVPRRLKRTVRTGRFAISVDGDFDAVIAACAEAAPDRRTTWINARIRALYGALFRRGHVHTVEVREGETRGGGRLVGGLYGVSLGGAFFGESMFSRATDASKVALVHLVERLRAGGYRLLDTQFLTEHLQQFGAIEIPRADYLQRLEAALRVEGDFHALDGASREAL